MPEAGTRMRTCPADGCGISRSTISKSAPGFGTCATFIFAMGILRFYSGFEDGNWMHVSRKPTHSDALQRSAGRKKVLHIFRNLAPPHQLTCALPRRTLRPTITKQQTGIGRAHRNYSRHLNFLPAAFPSASRPCAAKGMCVIVGEHKAKATTYAK